VFVAFRYAKVRFFRGAKGDNWPTPVSPCAVRYGIEWKSDIPGTANAAERTRLYAGIPNFIATREPVERCPLRNAGSYPAL
jgi:hypothetical protein